MATALPSQAVLTHFTVRHPQRQLRTIGSIGHDSGAPTGADAPRLSPEERAAFVKMLQKRAAERGVTLPREVVYEPKEPGPSADGPT